MILKKIFFLVGGGELILDDYDCITCWVVKKLLFFLQSKSKYHFVAARFKQIASVINLFSLCQSCQFDKHINQIIMPKQSENQPEGKQSGLWANSLVC